MNMVDGVIVNESGAISDRQVALLAASIMYSGYIGERSAVYNLAQEHLQWLRQEE